MPHEGDDIQQGRTATYTAATSGLRGEEYEEAMRKLVNQENDIRKLWAYRLRGQADIADVAGQRSYASGLWAAAELLDPCSGVDGENGKFARSEYAGNGWVKP